VRKDLIITLIALTIIIFTASALVTWALTPRADLKPSDYNVGIPYELAMKADKPFVALFYADWCTYCKRFMPKYKILSEVYGNKYNFVMLNVENPAYQKVVRDYVISGFPTIYIIDPSIDNRILINNGLYDNLFSLRTEFDRYLRVRAMIKG
jgi:thiol-disulfide isomerase/thioredoxin